MIEIMDSVTLDNDKEYVVTSKTDYNDGKTYYYLVNIEDKSDIKFGYLDNDEFVETNNQNLIKELLPSFVENGMKLLPKDMLDKL